MAEFRFITKGNSHPQGKSKVYYCAHPDDHMIYLRSVANDLLTHQNCAVWFYPPRARTQDFDREDYELHLSQMQLFVIPVTTNFLSKKSYALEEFAFALEHHIPILPLMQEPGLDSLFNEICGDIQYLDKNQRDETAIGYHEKLNKFLSSVLIGDELAEKIRAAFDAYIFLSYRKKDRKYAQELMRLIHHDDSCRDIAIWYDEFLTPGENFNDSIGKMLTTSDVFALVVTPNLVNETNYVMTTEYPMARKAGKHVVPVEFVKTDRSALEKHYQEIDPCVEAIPTAVSDAFLQQLHKLAIKEEKASPEHTFFIGLAYLSGIDVEVDHKRALSMITAAADAGLIEAMEKLISMYKTGEGVKRNYANVIKWQVRLNAARKKLYEKTKSWDHCNGCFWSMIDLGDYQRDIGRLSYAENNYRNAMNLMQSYLHDSQREDGFRNLSVAYLRLGSISKANGNFDDARECYLKALGIVKQLIDEGGATELYADLSTVYDMLGTVCKDAGQVEEAKSYYQKAMMIAKSFSNEEEDHEMDQDMAVSYERLGDICWAEGNLKGAKEYYEKSLAISERHVKELETEESFHNLSCCYTRLGDVYRAEGNLPKAKMYYRKALDIDEKLANDLGTIKARRDLVVSYDCFGKVNLDEGDLAEAKRCFELAFQISKELVKAAETVDSRRGLADSYARLGYISEIEGRYKDARLYYLQCLAIREDLIDGTDAVYLRSDLANIYGKLGDVYLKEGNTSVSLSYYEKSLAINEKLVEENDTVGARSDLLSSYNDIGDLYKRQSDYRKARIYFQRALTLAQELHRETASNQSERDLSICYDRMGDVCSAEGNRWQAKNYYQKSLAIAERLANETGTPEAYRDLSISYDRVGDMCLAENNLAMAKTYYRKGAEIAEKRLKRSRTVEALNDCVVSYNNLGVMNREEGNYNVAKMYFKKIVEIYNELILMTKTSEYRYKLFKAILALGETAQAGGTVSEAKTYYLKATSVLEELIKAAPSEEYWQELSLVYHTLAEISADGQNDADAVTYYRKSIDAIEKRRTFEDSFECRYDLISELFTLGFCFLESSPYDAKACFVKALAIDKRPIERITEDSYCCYLMYITNSLGNIVKTEGNVAEARRLYLESAGIAERLVSNGFTVDSRHDLAIAYYNLSLLGCSKQESDYLKKAVAIWQKLCEEDPENESFRECLLDAKERLSQVFAGQ